MGSGEELEVKVGGSTTELDRAMEKSAASVDSFARIVEAASSLVGNAYQRIGRAAEDSGRQSKAAASDFASAYGAAVDSVQSKAGALERAYRQAANEAERSTARQSAALRQAQSQGVGQLVGGIAQAATAKVNSGWSDAYSGGVLRNAYQQAIALAQRSADVQQQSAARAASWGAAFERTMFTAGQTAAGASTKITAAGGAIGRAFDVAGRGALYLNQAAQLATGSLGLVETVIQRTIGQAAQQGDAYQDLSRRLQIPVESLSRIGFASQLAGAPIEEMGQSFKSSAKAIADASTAGTDANRIFTEGLGFTTRQIRELQSLSPDEAILRLGEAFAKTEDSAQKTADMALVFGRGYQAVLALIADGPEEIQKNIELAEKLGITWDTKTAAAGDRLGDSVSVLEAALSGLNKRVVGNTETMDPLSAAIERAALKVADLGKNIPEAKLEAMRQGLAAGADAAGDFIVRGIDAILARLPELAAGLQNITENALRYLTIAARVAEGAAIGAAMPVPGGTLIGAGAGLAIGLATAPGTKAEQEAAAANQAAQYNRQLDHRIDSFEKLAQAADAAGNAQRAADLRGQKNALIASRPIAGEVGSSQLPVEAPNASNAPAGWKPPPVVKTKYDRSTAAGASGAAAAARAEFEEMMRLKALELDAVHENAAARLVIEQKYTKQVGDKYGEQSAEYQKQLHDQNDAARAAAEERLRVARIEIEAEKDHKLRSLELQKVNDQAQLDRGEITHQEFLTRLQAYYDQRRQVIQDALDAEAALKPQTPEEQAETKAKATAAADDQKAGGADVSAQRDVLSTEALKEYAAAWEEMWTGIESSTSRAITGMVNGTMRFGQAARTLTKGVLNEFVQMGVKMVIHFAADVAKMVLAWLFGETLKTTSTIINTQIRRAVESSANKASVLEMAIMAFSGAYASASQIPYVGWILGPIAGAVAFAAVMAMGAGISAEGGAGDIPAGGPTRAILHPREMVLPAPIAHVIRDMAAGYSGGSKPKSWSLQAPSFDGPELGEIADVIAGRQTRATEGGDGDAAGEGATRGGDTFHINISTMDAKGVEHFIRQPNVATAFARGMHSHARLTNARR